MEARHVTLTEYSPLVSTLPGACVRVASPRHVFAFRLPDLPTIEAAIAASADAPDGTLRPFARVEKPKGAIVVSVGRGRISLRAGPFGTVTLQGDELVALGKACREFRDGHGAA